MNTLSISLISWISLQSWVTKYLFWYILARIDCDIVKVMFRAIRKGRLSVLRYMSGFTNHLLETVLLCFWNTFLLLFCVFFFLLFPSAWYRHCQLINIKVKTVNILSTKDFITDYSCVCCLYLFLQQNTAYHTTSHRNKISFLLILTFTI